MPCCLRGAARLLTIAQRLAAREGPIVPIYLADADGRYPLEFLVGSAASASTRRRRAATRV